MCVYVCLSVTGLLLKYMGLRTSLARAAHDAITVEVEDSRIEDNARMSPEIWKTVNCSTKNER